MDEYKKCEFEFLKGLFYILLITFFGNVSYIFTKELSVEMYILSILSIASLLVANILILTRGYKLLWW